MPLKGECCNQSSCQELLLRTRLRQLQRHEAKRNDLLMKLLVVKVRVLVGVLRVLVGVLRVLVGSALGTWI